MSRLNYTELRDGKVVWLFDLSWNGQTFRWASEPVHVPTDDGISYRYNGGLDFDLQLAYEFLSEYPDLVSIPMSLVFPVSIAELIGRGYDLSAATGELSLWVAGRTYEQRQTVVVGVIEAPEYGRDGEPIAFSLKEFPGDDVNSVVDPEHEVSVLTFPTAPTSSYGRIYPFVFGSPGISGTLETTGSPATLYDEAPDEAIVVADHPVVATQATLVNMTQENAQTITIGRIFDSLGQMISVSDVSALAAAPVAGDDLWIRWDDGGAVSSPIQPSTALDGAGSLLYLMLKKTGLRIDSAACIAACQYLDAYKVAGYIDADIKSWDWTRQNVLSILPVSMLYGPNGLYPLIWKTDITDADVITSLTDGVNCRLDGRAQYENTTIVNSCTIKYCLRADTDEYLKRVTIGNKSTDSGLQLIAAASQSRYGVRSETIETAIIYDDATAYRIASDRIRSRGLRRRLVTVDCNWSMAWLERGQVVELNVTSLYIESAIAIVQSIQYQPTGISLQLCIVEDPLRDRRISG